MASPVSIIGVFVVLTTCAFYSSCCHGDESRKELRSRRRSGEEEVNPQPANTSSNSVLLQSIRVQPSRVIPLSWRPRVFLYKGFFTDEECDHLISWAQLSKADDSGQILNHTLLQTSRSLLNLHGNMLAMIDERISAWTLLPNENSEPLQVMHYGAEDPRHKFDYFGNESALVSSGHLMATLVIYLSDATRGGEILFPLSEINSKSWSDCAEVADILKPVKGNAILFFSMHLNASLDSSSSHARCPVLEGKMWCATKFFYLKPTEGRKELSEYDGTECSDEDENCPRWAALGECNRNPVFMIGSPDYYGTCRKSCGAC